MLATGMVKPLPYLKYELSNVDTALRQFSHARHTGKIVVSVPPALPSPISPKVPEAWAITGGLGALGSITAEWLAGQGAAYLHLLGRSGRWTTRSTGDMIKPKSAPYANYACPTISFAFSVLLNNYKRLCNIHMLIAKVLLGTFSCEIKSKKNQRPYYNRMSLALQWCT